MSEIGRLIDRAVNLGLRPRLRDCGFRRNSTHYWRGEGDVIQVLSVQKSQWNSSDSGKFTLNLGVHFPLVAEVLLGRDNMPRPPQESYCILRQRAGMLLSGRDEWWTVTPETDVDELAGTLQRALEEHVLPWFERNKSLPQAAGELERQKHYLPAAAVRLVLGETEEAARLVQSAIRLVETGTDFQHPANADLKAKYLREYRDWARKHRLPLE